jgi:hypothetical protein
MSTSALVSESFEALPAREQLLPDVEVVLSNDAVLVHVHPPVDFRAAMTMNL